MTWFLISLLALVVVLLLAWKFMPGQPAPKATRTFLRAQCEVCGKHVAHTKHGKAWKHRCLAPIKVYPVPEERGAAYYLDHDGCVVQSAAPDEQERE